MSVSLNAAVWILKHIDSAVTIVINVVNFALSFDMNSILQSNVESFQLIDRVVMVLGASTIVDRRPEVQKDETFEVWRRNLRTGDILVDGFERGVYIESGGKS